MSFESVFCGGTVAFVVVMLALAAWADWRMTKARNRGYRDEDACPGCGHALGDHDDVAAFGGSFSLRQFGEPTMAQCRHCGCKIVYPTPRPRVETPVELNLRREKEQR